MRGTRQFAAAMMIACTCSLAPAAPPTDERIDQFITQANEAGKGLSDPGEKAAARMEAVKTGMADIDWAEVTAAQLDRLATKGLLRPYPEMRSAVLPRLKALAAEPTLEGARCADITMACWLPPRAADAAAVKADQDQRCAFLLTALKHPKMADLFKAGKGGNLISAVPQFPIEVIREQKLVEAVEPFITTDMLPMSASALGGLFDVVTSTEYGASPEFASRLRGRIAAAATGAATRDDPRLADDPKQAASIRRNLKDLAATCNSAFARGELLDHPAPPISFTWTNYPTTLRSFDDLKGKVVVVDFWATWCGPCVGSFPSMRRLAAHYKGFPVVILGVTSDQGFHIARSLKEGSKVERIECEGDAEKEHDLMRDFIRDMDMTWPVAFSEQNVFNPEFGVRGIPHIAIIDPAGKVRFNALRPGNPAEEVDKINGLLGEFKLAAPEGTIGPEK